jgi:hypothetical protein
MHHILGNKNPIGSIGVLIDRANPGVVPVNRCQRAVYFNGRGWPSKGRKCKK